MGPDALHRRLDSWIRDQRTRILNVVWPPPWRIALKWPWLNARGEQQKKIHEEMACYTKKLQDLCCAVKADTLPELQEILCCMVLSECVYKREAADMVCAVNNFKSEFGGQLVHLERVQPSSEHVPHRYILAEAGDTLFASFIGTKQYKDVMADANIFQGAIFNDDPMVDASAGDPSTHDNQKDNGKNVENYDKHTTFIPNPAVHRGFMARAKGIPALELYRLAQKKRRKLVLCGHSLGGAVAVLATLAILRVKAVASKEIDTVQVRCITFSQPPVGNAALRDYVNGKGWQDYFRTYCIPEDLVPRILSPAYFQHYNNAQMPLGAANVGSSPTSKQKEEVEKQKEGKLKDNEAEKFVLGLGPVQNSFWRLSKLVPIEGLRRQIFKSSGRKVDSAETSTASAAAAAAAPSTDYVVAAPQTLEIEESSDSISLRPLPEKNENSVVVKNQNGHGYSENARGDKRVWYRIPSLPSYVPFGQLYLLGSSSVESLSGSEYSKLTSVRSLIAEVKEGFQSHSMKSYRSRFQRIYEHCMKKTEFSPLEREHELKFPQLQKWLGIHVAGRVELGLIVDSPFIRAATSLVPLGWTGTPNEKNPLKVDISGFGLHVCSLVQARVNGKWCSTTVETSPSPPAYSQQHELHPEMQKMRLRVGAPLRQPPQHKIPEYRLKPGFLSINPNSTEVKLNQNNVMEENSAHPGSLSEFVVFCTNDFSTVAKEVHIRTRSVQLIGLEGAGKTSLLKAVLDQGGITRTTSIGTFPVDAIVHEGVAGGLLYSDSKGVKLQNLNAEASRFRNELWKGIRDLRHKIDLVVLVHNLSHWIPRYSQTNELQQSPLLLLLDEVKSLGVPWVLAITNKFSVSADEQKAAIDAVLQAYQAFPSLTEVINSCPYVMPTAEGGLFQSWLTPNTVPGDMTNDGQKLVFDPINLIKRSFQRKPIILPVEGVAALRRLIHRVLLDKEEAALQELARDRILFELERERAAADRDAAAVKSNPVSDATLGASVGAGIGIALAIILGAASALRKP